MYLHLVRSANCADPAVVQKSLRLRAAAPQRGGGQVHPTPCQHRYLGVWQAVVCGREGMSFISSRSYSTNSRL